MTKGFPCIVLRILLLLMVQGVCSTVAAQQLRKIDSLGSLLPGKTDLERADIYYELAYEWTDFNNALGVEFSEKSFQFARKAGDSLRMVKAGRIKAAAFRRLGELDSAIVLWLEMLPIATRNAYGTEVKKILRGTALAYTYKANYDLGLQYNFELLKATEEDNDSLEMSYALTNIGLIYYKLVNLEKALKYYYRALDVKPSSDTYPWTSTFINISLCYSQLKDFPKAGEFLRKGFEACQPECHNHFVLEWLQANGRIHFYKDDLDSAEVYYLKAYALAKKSGNKRFHLILISSLTSIYVQRNQVSLALQYLSEGESMMQRSPYEFELIDLYSWMFSFYKTAGDEKKRSYYQAKYIQLKDRIYDQRLGSSLKKIESDHLERANKARITEQEQVLILKDQVIKRQNALNILMGIITILLIALLYTLYRSNHERRSANRLLERKVKERTAALESNHLALKHSFEESDVAISSSFLNIKSSTATIKGLCSLGLEDGNDIESRKCLLKISAVAQEVSLTLSRISEVQKEAD